MNLKNTIPWPKEPGYYLVYNTVDDGKIVHRLVQIEQYEIGTGKDGKFIYKIGMYVWVFGVVGCNHIDDYFVDFNGKKWKGLRFRKIRP